MLVGGWPILHPCFLHIRHSHLSPNSNFTFHPLRSIPSNFLTSKLLNFSLLERHKLYIVQRYIVGDGGGQNRGRRL